MHAVLPMPANGLGLHLLRDTLEKHSEPALTATNEGSSPSSHSLTGSECVKAWERVPRKPGFHLTNDSTALTTLDGDRPSEVQSERKGPHSIQTEYLSGSLGKGAVLAGPSLMTSFVEHGTASKPYQRALPAEEASYPEHRSSADLRDREGNQVHKQRSQRGVLRLIITVRLRARDQSISSVDPNDNVTIDKSGWQP
jgi:hypothetical protein